jgi:diguanylate cyclase (GGDEF)-like protein
MRRHLDTAAAATLLVVDDDAANRDALSRRLVRAGYSVLTADDGTAALQMLADRRVDLVLLDVMMPGVSGIDVLRCIRKSRSIAELPIIMVTANDGTRDTVIALDAGANDYVTKPVDFAVALARIRTQLSARRSDPLTGLPNRVLFMERLEQRVARAAAGAAFNFAVLFLDVDRFKVVNDSLGHVVGDALLVEVAKRLEQSLRAGDTIARIDAECTLARVGGDEFTVLLEGTPDAAVASAVADRLVQAVAQPFAVQGREVVASVSVGIVMGAERYSNAVDMIRDADTAMYCAKAAGKARHQVFDTSMLAAVEQRLMIESDLRYAVARGQLRLLYQPIVSLTSNELCGFEALLRWEHPTLGLLSPDQFIGVAEETGLIVSIGMWALRSACCQMREWDAKFPDASSLTVNVNLSARQCVDPALADKVAQVLAETGLPPQRLKLEITENIVLQCSEAIVDVLGELRALGVQLGLDDFGMGYSALGYLQRLPVQTLKIDRSFVNGLEEAGSREIVRAILSLAAGLAMDVTAEGVETADQAARLKALACEFGQGFYFFRPLTPSDAGAVLADRTWAIAAVAASHAH